MYKLSIYEKLQNISINWDAVLFQFDGDKTLKLHTEKNIWDGDVYLDFPIIELYSHKLLSIWRIDDIEIKLVEWQWILLCMGWQKIFIPWYQNSVYYTSDMTLVVEYSYNGEKNEKKFDMKDWVYNFC